MINRFAFEEVDVQKPHRKLFGHSCLGVVKGHNASQGSPPLVNQTQPPSPFIDGDALDDDWKIFG